REQRVGDRERVAAARPVADDQREQLVVAERRHTMTAQLLARPIVGRQVLHLTPSLRGAAPAGDTPPSYRLAVGRVPRAQGGRYTGPMRRVRRVLISIAFAAAATTAACADPPEKEMQQAQGAIDAAKAAGADQYAHDEFTAA